MHYLLSIVALILCSALSVRFLFSGSKTEFITQAVFSAASSSVLFGGSIFWYTRFFRKYSTNTSNENRMLNNRKKLLSKIDLRKGLTGILGNVWPTFYRGPFNGRRNCIFRSITICQCFMLYSCQKTKSYCYFTPNCGSPKAPSWYWCI